MGIGRERVDGNRETKCRMETNDHGEGNELGMGKGKEKGDMVGVWKIA